MNYKLQIEYDRLKLEKIDSEGDVSVQTNAGKSSEFHVETKLVMGWENDMDGCTLGKVSAIQYSPIEFETEKEIPEYFNDEALTTLTLNQMDAFTAPLWGLMD